MEAWKTWTRMAAGQTLTQWQDGRCAMCDAREQLVSDHCHMTGLVRGLLCRSCNTSEAFSEEPHWVAWRNWDNPAHEFGVVEVHHGYGGLNLSPRSLMQHMEAAEREAWWAQQSAAAAAGKPWPGDVILSPAAIQRRREFDEELDRIAEMLT